MGEDQGGGQGTEGQGVSGELGDDGSRLANKRPKNLDCIRQSRSDREILQAVVDGETLNHYEIARVFNLLNLFPTKTGVPWKRQSIKFIEDQMIARMGASMKHFAGTLNKRRSS
jgi:hypothetical protein